eukprot:COSAG06_NODE_5128_length_3698_cov_1.762156_4_plen_131_part_00
MSFTLPNGEVMSLAYGGNATGAPAFTTASSYPQAWKLGVEFVFSRVGVPWIESRCAVRNVTARAGGGGGGSDIFLAEPCWSSFVQRGCASRESLQCAALVRPCSIQHLRFAVKHIGCSLDLILIVAHGNV